MRIAELSGLPDGAIEHFEGEGIDELYPPQAQAVEAGALEGENLVAAVPTASGKTMIAAMAMLSAIERGGTALYIVPLRALASEKYEEFGRFEAFGVSTGLSVGDYESTSDWLASRDLIVATSEKVDSLVRNDADWLSNLTCVVADEVHLVDDSSRGPTLEVTLAKLRELARRNGLPMQLVALSATVGNAGAIADWLDANLVDSEWRPIDLKTGVHYGNALNFADGSQRQVGVKASERPEAALVRDIVEEGGSSLVFVNSRRNAESAAERLGPTTAEFLSEDEEARLAELAAEIRAVSDTETSEDLAACVEGGSAFHHAGLASEHRSLVENAFRERLLKAVSATPTLSAGVNTPARRVIVRDWRRFDSSAGGMAPLSVLEVHQMMGRAGRPGLDPYGEAVLLAKSHEEMAELFDRYCYADPEPVQSKLAAEPALRTHVLATIASGFARTRTALLEFLEETLYASQSAEIGRLETVTDRVIAYLEANDFVERQPVGGSVGEPDADGGGTASVEVIEDGESDGGVGDESDGGGSGEADGGAGDKSDGGVNDEADAGEDDAPDPSFTTASDMLAAADRDERLTATSLGHTVSRLYIDPMSAAEIVHGLESAEERPTALGCYQLVARTPDMYELYLRSGDEEVYTELFYEREAELLGDPPGEFEDRFEDWLSALKTGKLLEDWASELDEGKITDRYRVGPGDLRGKVETAEWLLGATQELAREIDSEWVAAVREARKRVEHGVGEELLELVRVNQVGRKRARRLYDAGIRSPAELRAADKGVVLWALEGPGVAETVLREAGHPDPSMDGVSPTHPEQTSATVAGDGEVAGEQRDRDGGGSGGEGHDGGGREGGVGGRRDDEETENQSSLGDF